jgi:hypothetical protein
VNLVRVNGIKVSVCTHQILLDGKV